MGLARELGLKIVRGPRCGVTMTCEAVEPS